MKRRWWLATPLLLAVLWIPPAAPTSTPRKTRSFTHGAVSDEAQPSPEPVPPHRSESNLFGAPDPYEREQALFSYVQERRGAARPLLRQIAVSSSDLQSVARANLHYLDSIDPPPPQAWAEFEGNRLKLWSIRDFPEVRVHVSLPVGVEWKAGIWQWKGRLSANQSRMIDLPLRITPGFAEGVVEARAVFDARDTLDVFAVRAGVRLTARPWGIEATPIRKKSEERNEEWEKPCLSWEP